MTFLLEGLETERLIFRKVDRQDYNSWLEFFKTLILENTGKGITAAPRKNVTGFTTNNFIDILTS